MPAILGSVLGFAGDYLSPIFSHILLWALLFTLALVLISWWQYRVSLSGKWSARTLPTSLMIQNGQIRQELETLNEEVVKQTYILHSIEKGTTKTGNSVTQVQ